LFTGLSFNDSSTESRKEYLRPLESLARWVHFKSIYGKDANVDQETIRLVKEIVGPAIVGETVLIPVYKSLLGVGSDLFKK